MLWSLDKKDLVYLDMLSTKSMAICKRTVKICAIHYNFSQLPHIHVHCTHNEIGSNSLFLINAQGGRVHLLVINS